MKVDKKKGKKMNAEDRTGQGRVGDEKGVVWNWEKMGCGVHKRA